MSWYKDRSVSYVLKQKAQAIARNKDFDANDVVSSAENIHAHPLMEWIESLNFITNEIKTTSGNAHAFDLEEIDKLYQSLNLIMSQIQSERTLFESVNKASKHLDELLVLLRTQGDYEDQYISYFFVVMSMRRIEYNKIARAVVDMPSPEVRFSMDEKLIGSKSISIKTDSQDMNIKNMYEDAVRDFHNTLLKWVMGVLEDTYSASSSTHRREFYSLQGELEAISKTFFRDLPLQQRQAVFQAGNTMSIMIWDAILYSGSDIRWHGLKPFFDTFRVNFRQNNSIDGWDKIPQ